MNIQEFIDYIVAQLKKRAPSIAKWVIWGVSWIPIGRVIRSGLWLVLRNKAIRSLAVSIAVDAFAIYAKETIQGFKSGISGGSDARRVYDSTLMDWRSEPSWLRRYVFQALREAVLEEAWEAFIQYLQSNLQNFDQPTRSAAHDAIYIHTNDFYA